MNRARKVQRDEVDDQMAITPVGLAIGALYCSSNHLLLEVKSSKAQKTTKEGTSRAICANSRQEMRMYRSQSALSLRDLHKADLTHLALVLGTRAGSLIVTFL